MHQLAALMGPSALAVKELTVNKNAQDGTHVRIVGRKSGLADWFLSLIGIDTTTVFEVYSDHIKFTEGNLSGRTTTVIPLSALSSSSSGYFKPLIYFLIGIPLIPMFGLGFLFIIYYFLHKTLVVTTTSHSSAGAAIAFKRSVVEGVKVEQKQAEEIIDIINSLTLAQQKATVS